MHELSICQALLREVHRVASDNGARAVERIIVRVGPLSGVETPLLERAFTVARAGTLADGAELVIERPPVRVRCTQCHGESTASANRLLCGVCGDWRTRLVSGDEMVLAGVEMLRPARVNDMKGAGEQNHV